MKTIRKWSWLWVPVLVALIEALVCRQTNLAILDRFFIPYRQTVLPVIIIFLSLILKSMTRRLSDVDENDFDYADLTHRHLNVALIAGALTLLLRLNWADFMLQGIALDITLVSFILALVTYFQARKQSRANEEDDSAWTIRR